MNYYQRHIGDYQTATADLSMLEHGAYSMLLDAYYSREKPPSADPARLYQICKAMTKQERAAVDLVVARFFTIDGDVARNRKADEVIETYQSGAEARRQNGKLGGRPRKPTNNLAGFSQGTKDITYKKGNPESRIQNPEIQEDSSTEESCSEPVEATAAEPGQEPAMTFPVVGTELREWPLYADRIADWQECYPGIDALSEAKKARQWCIANETKRKTPRGMMKFLNGWMSRAQDDSAKHSIGRNGTAITRPSGAGSSTTLLDREHERERQQLDTLRRFAESDDPMPKG